MTRLFYVNSKTALYIRNAVSSIVLLKENPAGIQWGFFEEANLKKKSFGIKKALN